MRHCLHEVLPGRDRGVDGGDVAGAQIVEDGGAVPIADVEAVDDYGVVVEFIWGGGGMFEGII